MKLMKYTKRGNQKWFKKELKSKGFKSNHKLVKKQPELRPLFNSTNSTRTNFYKGITDINNTDLNSVSNEQNKTSSSFFTNYKNTIKTVRNEADKARYICQNFDKKIKTMENFF